MDEEKRRFVRWKKKVKVGLALPEEDLYEEIFTEDVSESGLQILLGTELASEQTVKLRLEFVYDSVPIIAFARVAHIQPKAHQYRVGLEFMDMSDFERERLKRYLEKARQEI